MGLNDNQDLEKGQPETTNMETNKGLKDNPKRKKTKNMEQSQSKKNGDEKRKMSKQGNTSKNDNNNKAKRESEIVPGGLQITKTHLIKKNPSNETVGHISGALMGSASSKVILHKLASQKENTGKPDLIYPTRSRIYRVNQENSKKKTWSKKLCLTAAKYDLWAIQTIPHSENIAYNICVTLAPLLILLTIWDMLAVMVFQIPHLSCLNSPGILYPFYPIGTICSLYGYMMRFLMEDYSRKTKICFIGVFLYPALLIWRCVIHYQFNGYRDERKLFF